MKAHEVENEFDLILKEAEEKDVNPALIAITNDLTEALKFVNYWAEPKSFDDETEVYAENIDLLAGYDDVLSLFCSSIAQTVKFPRSSVFLHGLGVVSAAMTENFYWSFNLGSKKTPALYTVVAQPPSTGKSGVNDLLCEPGMVEYEKKRVNGAKDRAKILRQIAIIKKSLEKCQPNEAMDKEEEIIELQEELKKFPEYTWAINDATPEGCEKILTRQNGFYNVISDETSTIQVVLGNVYGNGANNNGVFLKAWDNGILSVARGGRDGYSGRARGAIVLCAQDVSIGAILQAGSGGEGISERFLMLMERNLLGTRRHDESVPISREAKRNYEELIENIVHQPYEVLLTFSKAARTLITNVQNEQEPLMADNGPCSSPMLRGVVGKNQSQICKIASVLHVVDEWSDKGSRKTEIQIGTVVRAVSIFQQLLKTYMAAADTKGFSGIKTELEAVIKTLEKRAEKPTKQRITIKALYDLLKNKHAFAGTESLTGRLRERLLPMLQSHNYIVYREEKGGLAIYINPKLKL